MILLDIDARDTNAVDSTHKYFPFEVPGGLQKLHIRFSFDPATGGEEGLAEVIETLKREAPYRKFSTAEAAKFLPLKNHVVLSLDAPDGWVGTRHRFAPSQTYVIGTEFADDGFMRVPIKAGRWQVSLAFNAVVTPEIAYRVIVEGEK